jgi:hypothetical protein
LPAEAGFSRLDESGGPPSSLLPEVLAFDPACDWKCGDTLFSHPFARKKAKGWGAEEDA